LRLKPYVPVFEQLIGINVGYEMIGESEMRRKRQIDLAAGSGLYDVVAIGLTYVGEAHTGNWLQDLWPLIKNPELTDPEWYKANDIGATFIQMLERDGKLLALPIGPSAPIFWYRKDLFDKYGIDVPDTYEDVIAMKEQLQKAMEDDGLENIYAFTTRAKRGAGRNTWTTTACIRAYGGRVFDENWNCAVNSAESVEAMSVYKNMITGYGSPPGSEAMGFYEIVDMFAAGQLASMIAGVDHIVFINDPDKSVVYDKWEADLIPRGPDGRFTSPWAWSLGINSASRKTEPAWLFLQWASSQPTMELLGTGISPSRMALWDSEPFRDLNRPGWIKAAKWSWEEGTLSRLRSGIPEFPEVGEILSVAYSDIFYGADIQSTLDKAVIDVNRVMEAGQTKK
jgi:multiple sugar transport system substrate-binding protein